MFDSSGSFFGKASSLTSCHDETSSCCVVTMATQPFQQKGIFFQLFWKGSVSVTQERKSAVTCMFRLEESIWSLDWIVRGLHRQDMAIV
jgi:hypothetical protein